MNYCPIILVSSITPVVPPNSWNVLLWSFIPQLLTSWSSPTGLYYTLNSWNILLWCLFPQLFSSSSSSAGWNNSVLIKYCTIILLTELLGSSSSSTGLNYTLNSWNVLLWSLFSKLLPRSSSLAWVLAHWTHEIFSINASLFSQFLGSSSSLAWVQVPWTHEIFSILYSLFSPLLDSSRSSAWFN